jgi:malonyl-CoA/methylmalonyl-CoA synthetase
MGVRWSRAGWRAHLSLAGAGAADALVADVLVTDEAAADAAVADAAVADLVGQFGAATIPDLAAESAGEFPDRVAVSVAGVPMTHAGLDAAAGRVAGWLAARIGPGDRVLLAASAGPGFLRCYLGALRAGAVVVLASPGYTAAELGHLVTDSGAQLAFADPGPAGRLATLAHPPHTVLVSDPECAGRPLPPVPQPGDIALLAYTSGTTGWPKGVPLTHRQLATSIRSAMAAWRWTSDDVLVHALPLFHQHGLGGVHATLVAGSTAHLQSRFAPAGLIELARRTAATVLFGVPASYQALLDAARESGALAGGPRVAGSSAAGPLLGGLRLAVCGSAPLSPDLARELPGLLGQLPLIRYGTTESGLDVSNPVGGARAGTVGLPLPGVECRVWSPRPFTAAEGAAEPEPRSGTEPGGGGGAEAGRVRGAKADGAEVAEAAGSKAAEVGGSGQAEPGGEAAAGAVGEIQLRGPQVFTGYWGDPAATVAAFTADGWFRTGDIGAVDPASGHLVIRGRIKELIITGGLNVYPREVEIALESHPAVAEAAVAAVPHPRWGEQVTAWVVLRPGHTLDEGALIAHARTRLAAYKCPKQVFQLAALPRNALGKLNRRALRPPGDSGQPHGGGAG